MDYEHGPSWIDTNSIFIAWKPRKNHSGLVSIPPKYITLQKRILLGSHKKQTTSNEKLVGLCSHDYSFICNCSIHILVICMLLKTGVEFGLSLGMLYCLELDEAPHRIFHNEYLL